MPLFLPPIKPQPDPLNVTVADVAAAPTLYTAAHINSLVTLANANKAKINAVVEILRNAEVTKA